MPRSYPLSWDAAQERWRVQHEGVRHHVTCRQLQALGYLDPGVPHTKKGTCLAARRWWTDRLASIHSGQAVAPVRTSGMTDHINKWLLDQESLARSGRISPGELSNRRYQVEPFRAWWGSRPVAALNEDAWSDWYRFLLRCVSEGRWVRTYAQKVHRTARTLISDLSIARVLDPPRNLHDRRMVFPSPPPVVVVLDVATARALLDQAGPALRVHFLMFMNCGMTQVDTSDLAQNEVDWVSGRVSRVRSKTRRFGSVPVVSYPLWPVTFEALRQARSSDPYRVLLTRSGQPWVRKGLRPDGSVGNVDGVRACCRHLARRLGMPVVPKLFRKTSATLLASHPVHGRFDWLFLGHAPSTIRDRHYVRPDQALFDDAVLWLGKQYGLMP